MTTFLALIACHHRDPEDFHPCDPRGVRRPWEDLDDHGTLEYRLLYQLGTFERVDGQPRADRGDCEGSEDPWTCLGFEPLPPSLRFVPEWCGDELCAMRIVGPLEPGGPTKVLTAGEQDTGCGTTGWGASVEEPSGYGPWEPVRGVPRFAGDPPEVDQRLAELRRDLGSIRSWVRKPGACAEVVEGLGNQGQGEVARAAWDCLAASPLGELEATFDFRFRYVRPDRSTLTTRTGRLRSVELVGPLTPGGPVVRLRIRGGSGVVTEVHADSALDPRYVGPR